MPFSCDTIENSEIKEKIDRAKKVNGLAWPFVCLPNIHPKAGLESPPQFAAATKGTIVPQLSAPAMNCGISLFATNLSREDFSEEFLNTFAANLRKEVYPWIGRWKTALQWLGLYARPKTTYDLSRKELEDMFLEGAPAALQKYNLPQNEPEHIEYGGCVLPEEKRRSIHLKRLVPRSAYRNGRHELGYNFGGNHFLEFHYVENILDDKTAAGWGIRQNQILMFYHGGGGHATYHLGRYFGRREKNTPLEKAILFWLKIFFHFGSWEGIKQFRARWRAYFSRKPFPEIPLNSPEGIRLMQSIQIGLNYGYAFRAALLKRINDALPTGKAQFLWDAAHNSILEETINNEHVVVHRQDAVRVFHEKPVMIAGFNTLSYLGKGIRQEEFSLQSATPSAGKTIAQYEKEHKSKPDTSHYTLVSKRKETELQKELHRTSEGLFAVVKELENAGIITPVAYLRPIGTIKGH